MFLVGVAITLIKKADIFVSYSFSNLLDNFNIRSFYLFSLLLNFLSLIMRQGHQEIIEMIIVFVVPFELDSMSG